MAIYKITLSASSWTQSVAALYYNTTTPGKFYTDTAASVEITRLTIPTRELYKFDGFYSSSSGGTQYIDENGNFTDALLSLSITAAKTFYVHQTQWSYKITLNDYNGSGGQGAIYKKKTMETGDAALYVDYLCTTPVTTVAKPTRSGYAFKGYYNGTTTPGAQYIDKDGVPLSNLEAITAAKTVYAQWQANTYILTFDPNGGTTPTESKAVTFDAAVGTLPTPTHSREEFVRWEYNGARLTASTVWKTPDNGVAYAKWNKYFGRVDDFFDLASDALVPIASTNGDNKQRICVAHTGKYEPGVGDTSGIWRNPSVTYVVTKNTTVNVTLGKAYAGGSNLSGYMIVAVAVETRVGQFPTVTVEAVANEGANAINQFSVSIPVVARSKAQNLLGAVNGGGYLNACTVRASCDPVVIAENMMPCASDVVHGRLEVAATTIAANGENAPTAGGNFTSVGEPKQQNEASYTVYTLNAQKEIA